MASHVRNFYFWEKQRSYYKPDSVILITGAGSGIGKQVALVYAQRPCRLVLVDINADALTAVKQQCQLYLPHPDHCITIRTDVTQQQQCQQMIETTITTYHRLDIMVLCAGIGAHHLFADTKVISLYSPNSCLLTSMVISIVSMLPILIYVSLMEC